MWFILKFICLFIVACFLFVSCGDRPRQAKEIRGLKISNESYQKLDCGQLRVAKIEHDESVKELSSTVDAHYSKEDDKQPELRFMSIIGIFPPVIFYESNEEQEERLAKEKGKLKAIDSVYAAKCT